MAAESTQLEHFLQGFFGPGNAIRLADIRSANLPEAQADYLRTWLPDLEKHDPSPVVLPRKREEDGKTIWYAFAFNSQQLRALRSELHAAIGVTYTDFRGQEAVLNPGDLVEAAALEFLGPDGGCFRFGVPDSRRRGDVRRSLARLHQLWQRRPIRTSDVARPTGRILRDFHQALNAGDGLAADDFLRELRSLGRLSSVNLLFLRVERYARLRQWEQLLRLEDLPRLVGARRPPRVSDAIANAYFYEHLADVSDQPPELLARFRSTPLPALIDDPSQASTPTGALYWAIGSIAVGRPEPVADWIATASVPGETVERVEKLLSEVDFTPAGVSSPDRGDPVEEALRLRVAGKHRDALIALRNAPPTRSTAELAIEWAFTLDTLEASTLTEEILGGLESVEVEDLWGHAVFGRMLRQVLRVDENENEDGHVAPLPGSWLEWFHQLATTGTWPGAVSIARDGALEWSVEPLVKDPSFCEKLADALEQARVKEPEPVREALPHFISFLERVDDPPARFSPLYEHLLIELVTGTVTRADLEAVRAVMEVLLRLSSAHEEYLEYVVELWREQGSANRLWFMSDIVDLLAQHATMKIELRTSAFREAFATAADSPSNVASGTWSLLQFLAEELSLGQEVEAIRPDSADAEQEEGSATVERLAGRTIALYSLTESAIARAKTIIESEYPECTVNLNSDHVGTDRLRAMAENADIFVMVTWSATHAATQFIEANRPEGSEILRPKGRGSSSILTEIREWASNN